MRPYVKKVILGIIIFSTFCFAAKQNMEIAKFIDQEIEKTSKYYNVPFELLKGLIKPHLQNGKVINFQQTNYAYEQYNTYLKQNSAYPIEKQKNHIIQTVPELAKFIAVSILINAKNLDDILSQNGYTMQTSNRWLFASISFLTGTNTSIELLNHFAKVNNPRFVKLMLTKKEIVQQYVCNSRFLFKSLKDVYEVTDAIDKHNTLTDYFRNSNYCKGGENAT